MCVPYRKVRSFAEAVGFLVDLLYSNKKGIEVGKSIFAAYAFECEAKYTVTIQRIK